MQRRLSGSEFVLWRLLQNTPFNLAVAVRIQGTIQLEHLRAALDRLRCRHPLLASRIETAVPGPSVYTTAGVPEFEVRGVVGHSDGDWISEAERELIRPFDLQAGPLARFVLVQFVGYADMVIVSHHLVADGLAATFLIRDVLTLLANPAASVTPAPLPASLTAGIPPVARRNFRTRAAVRLALAVIHGVYLERRDRSAKRDSHSVELSSALERRPVSIVAWSLDEAKTTTLIARCREERTSVYAALCVAFVKSFTDAGAFPQSRPFPLICPINVRNRLSVPVNDDVGLYSIGFSQSIDCHEDGDFWQDARTFHESFRASSTDANIFSETLFLEAIMPCLSSDRLLNLLRKLMFGRSAPTNGVHTASISNVGRLTIPLEYGPLRLVSWYGTAALNNDQVLIAVATVGGGMCFAITYSPGTLDDNTAVAVKARVLRYLADTSG